MKLYSGLANNSDYESFLLYQDFLQEICKDGCEIDEDVALTRNVLELILIPIIGSIGVLGNILNIIVLCKSNRKTTFQHVSKHEFFFN